MPRFSELDAGVAITDEYGAISLVTQHSGRAGHSMIVIEYMNAGEVDNVVAHLVALPSTNRGRPTQAELLSGWRGGYRLKTRILIVSGDSVKRKIANKLNCTSKTWSVSNAKLNNSLMLIGIHASLSDTRNPVRHDTTAQDYATSPHAYNFVGKLSLMDPQFGINCANWAVSVIEAAGVTGVGGCLIDIPSRLTLGGSPVPMLRSKL